MPRRADRAISNSVSVAAWQDRMLVETVLSMLDARVPLQETMHRGGDFRRVAAFTMGAMSCLRAVKSYTLCPNPRCMTFLKWHTSVSIESTVSTSMRSCHAPR